MNWKTHICAIAVAFAATGCTSMAGYQVKEVGSFHVGGKQVSLSGLPERIQTWMVANGFMR